MKIVHVHHYYWPVVGGLERVVQSIAEELSKLGHEVHVVTSILGAQGKPRMEMVNGVYVHRIKGIKLVYPDLIYPLEYPVKVLKDADIVHGHSQNSLFTVRMIEEARKLGVKTAMHFMALDSLNDHPNPLTRSLGPFYAKLILKKALRASNIKLVRSYRDMKILKNKYEVEAIYVPDGVSEELVKAPNMAEEFRTKYGIQDPFVVYVGRLHELKGLHILIKAMSIIVKEFPRLKAVIIGSGDQRPYKELAHRLDIENNIVFLGFVDEMSKVGALDASLALVLPSVCNYVEVYPMAISEAWARNKPVIASAVGGIPYRVKHMVNGLIVPPRDVKALAEAIMLLTGNMELSIKLGNKGRENILTYDRIAIKTLEIYQRYLKVTET